MSVDMTDGEGAPAEVPALPLLAVALVQSVALFVLHRAAEADAAFVSSPRVETALWTLTLVLPSQFMLLVGEGPLRRLVAGLAVSGLALLVVSVWTGHQLSPEEHVRDDAILFVYVLLTALLTFKATIWLQAWMVGRRPDYALLLAASWRTFLIPAQGAAFVGLFGAVLALWGGLFALVGIDFFADLFTEDWFLFPVLGLAFGTGVLLFRRMPGLLGGLDDRLRVAMALLLPLVLAVGAGFVAVLPFTGIDALWDTGRGTALLLWLVAFTTFFLNAVYAPGTTSPYPGWLERLVGPALLLLPIVAVLASWGLALRVGDYGITVARFWAMVVCGTLATFSFAYAGSFLRLRARWREGLGPVNVAVSLALLVLLVLAQSPLLDPKGLSVRSQLARVERGEIDLAEVDYRYFRRALGRAGWLAMERIREAHGDDAALLAELDRSGGRRPPTAEQEQALLDSLVRLPGDLELPDTVRERIVEELRPGENRRHWVIERDLDRDGHGDFVYLHQRGGSLYGMAFVSAGSAVPSLRGIRVEGSTAELRSALDALEAGEVVVAPPELDDLVLGEARVVVH